MGTWTSMSSWSYFTRHSAAPAGNLRLEGFYKGGHCGTKMRFAFDFGTPTLNSYGTRRYSILPKQIVGLCFAALGARTIPHDIEQKQARLHHELKGTLFYFPFQANWFSPYRRCSVCDTASSILIPVLKGYQYRVPISFICCSRALYWIYTYIYILIHRDTHGNTH